MAFVINSLISPRNKKKRDKGSVVHEHGQSGASDFPAPQLPARSAAELYDRLWPDEIMGEDFIRAVAEEKRKQAAQAANPNRTGSSAATRELPIEERLWPDSVVFGSPEEFTRIMGRPPSDLQPAKDERRTFKRGATLLGGSLDAEETSRAQTQLKSTTRMQKRTGAPSRSQADYEAPAQIQLDPRNETAINKYKLSERDILTQNAARQGQAQPLASGRTGSGAAYAGNIGPAKDSPARRNEIGGLSKSARPISQVGEGQPAELTGSGGKFVKNDAHNYSVYWPGLHNKQLEYISEEVRRLIAKSDTLKRQLRNHKDVKIVYAPIGEPTLYEPATKTIIIDGIKREDAIATIRSMAHEAAHADDSDLVMSSVASRLNSEGKAQMNRIGVRNDILANGGEDIGIGGSPENQPVYLEIYNQCVAGKISYPEATKIIGEIYGDKEHPAAKPNLTYREFYRRQIAEQYSF